MKIGLVCPYNIFVGGGVQECVKALQECLNKRGHQAYIITPQPRSYKGEVPKGVILIGGATPFRTFQTSSQISASRDLDKLSAVLEEENFDILHFHEPWAPMLSRQILTRSKAVNVGTFHAAMPDGRMTRTIEKVITPYTKSILKYLDSLTVVSPAAAKYVKTLTGKELNIVANGIDLKKYSRPTLKKPDHKVKTIFYIGRLEKRKGVKYLLEAFNLLKQSNPNYKLVIAGMGPDMSKLKDYVDDNGVEDVEFLGYIDEATKLRLFRESDLFCSPAIMGESFGIVLLEAMATGCVTVAGNNEGYAGVLSGFGQMCIVNPKDTVEFARRLALLTTDEDLRKLWQDWAAKEVKKYSYEQITEDYIEVYKAAYAQKHKKA